MKKAKIGLAIVTEKKIHELNKTYRQIDKSTDVLSFPLNETLPDGTLYVGDIVVSYDHIENKRDIISKVIHATADLLKDIKS